MRHGVERPAPAQKQGAGFFCRTNRNPKMWLVGDASQHAPKKPCLRPMYDICERPRPRDPASLSWPETCGPVAACRDLLSKALVQFQAHSWLGGRGPPEPRLLQLHSSIWSLHWEQLSPYSCSLSQLFCLSHRRLAAAEMQLNGDCALSEVQEDHSSGLRQQGSIVKQQIKFVDCPLGWTLIQR